MKKNVMIISAITMLSVSMISTLAYSQSAIDALTPLTGLDSETIVELRDSGSTFMDIATSEGVADEFRSVMQSIRIDRINQKLEDGKLTQEQADAAIEHITTAAETCDGEASGEKMNLAVGQTKQARLNRKLNNNN